MITRPPECKYWFGDIVFQRTMDDRVPLMVTGVLIRPSGIGYQLTWPGGSETLNFDFEITSEYVPDWANEHDEE